MVLAVGTNVFSSFLYVPEPFIGPSTKLIHLDSSAREVEKVYPTEVGILCDPKAGLEELFQALDQDMSGPEKETAATRAATLADERSRYHQGAARNLKEQWDRRSHGRRSA